MSYALVGIGIFPKLGIGFVGEHWFHWLVSLAVARLLR
jgi:hypothetical protein